ncbi:MAG: ACP S-malonyltransferase [SAR202 cluster bacterium]|jgi:[acyl-carrier-protein] S-malonyltransferase|nr:ACP S-malonyltransferase [SAR202 cluster bacterium]MDP6513928.1 ACP S-malonyltransferase [SAR202 cluster bacterium]MDP6713551.1 ACP S-malonyltransferase [SAR202 cluster bacterium]
MTLTFQTKAQGPKVAYLFPGQGAQAVGMGKELYDSSAAAREVFDQVDESLGRSLTKVLFEGPEDDLRQTINAQPGIMTVSLACVKAMEENLDLNEMPQPVVMAGHSLGEYTALAVSGVLDVADTAKLVQMRGQLMQEACDQNPGTMAAILGLDQMALEEVARETGVWVSNINTAEQIVISGDRMGIAQAMDLAEARGAKKVIALRVGGAFHSGLMEPARAGLVEAIDSMDFHNPTVPIVANCTADALDTADSIKEELIAQVSGCVQWKQSVDYMMGTGVDSFIEIGPGRALSGMVKRINRRAEIANVADLESIMKLRRN